MAPVLYQTLEPLHHQTDVSLSYLAYSISVIVVGVPVVVCLLYSTWVNVHNCCLCRRFCNNPTAFVTTTNTSPNSHTITTIFCGTTRRSDSIRTIDSPLPNVPIQTSSIAAAADGSRSNCNVNVFTCGAVWKPDSIAVPPGVRKPTSSTYSTSAATTIAKPAAAVASSSTSTATPRSPPASPSIHRGQPNGKRQNPFAQRPRRTLLTTLPRLQRQGPRPVRMPQRPHPAAGLFGDTEGSSV